LPETAADLETLDILSGFGMNYTILSPYQAKRSRKGRRGAWRDASGAKIDPTMPYKVRLPSGRRMAVFFYDGRISQAVAFEHLLDRGENLADRLTSSFSSRRRRPQIVHMATDGETYGHHHKYGDMALAYALHHIERNKSGTITNYGEYLSRHRPTHEAEIWERSAWSCAHGIDRWTRNCGCNSGSHYGWNQEWRTPLREAFNWLRDKVTPRFEDKGFDLFKDPWNARNEYIGVILTRSPDNVDEFLRGQATRDLSQHEKITALKLMEMQRHAMLMYTSCGWFFDELSGIETTQVIQYAARTLQLYEDIFGEVIEPMFLDRLESARSNIPEHKDGRVIYEKFVRPAMTDGKTVAAHYGLMSLVEPYPEEARVYCYKVRLEDSERVESGHSKFVIGTLKVDSEIVQESNVFSFGALQSGGQPMICGVHKRESDDDYNALKRGLFDAFNPADCSEALRILALHFGESTYSLGSIFHDDQRRILKAILQSTVSKVEAVYRQVYAEHAPVMRLLSDLRVPLPRAFSLAAQFALNSSLRAAFEDSGNFDITRINVLMDGARTEGVPLDGAELGFALEKAIRRLSEQCLKNPDSMELLKKLDAMAGLARSMPFEVNFWRTQNNYYQLLRKLYPGQLARTIKGDAQAQERVELLVALGRKLSFDVSTA
jgi:hypothetical protein